MVDLNVVAIDSRGQLVTDLTRDEFRVTDSGKPQTIAFFRHRDSALAQVPALKSNEVSNRGGNNIPRATLILFDLLNERFATRGVSANQIVHDLQSLESAEYVYLYLLGVDGRLFPVRGLPAEQAETAIHGGAQWNRQIKPILDQALRAVTQMRPPDIDVAVRVRMTYMALDAIALQLSRVPGRKSIVWVTDGVPIVLGPNRSDTGEVEDFTPLLRRMSEAFDRSGVSIYPVRMVMMGSPNSMDGGATPGLGSIDTLNEFAEMTGGRPDGGKDIGAALRQAVNDMRTSYQIAYYPPDKNWDDKYHKLRITTTRKGVRIQSKTAYYAWKEAPGARSEQAIDSAMATTFDAAEIGIRASLSPDPKGGRVMRLEGHIDAQDVVLVHQGDTYKGQLRIAVAGFVQGTRPEHGSIIPLDLHYTAQERDRALQQGIGITQNLTVAEDLKSVRLIVYDRESNAIGSVTIPVPASSGKPN
jgi:VWFA-related protein